jgi:hypothetical protein
VADMTCPPPLPLSELDEALIDISALRGELGELRPIVEAAHYVFGPPECAGEDPQCDEYLDDNGDSLPGMEYCSHVEDRYATYADVLVRQRLEGLVVELLGMVGDPTADTVDDARELIHSTIYGLVASGEYGVEGVDCTVEPYATVLEAADVANELDGIAAVSRDQ